jgi:hypothetical protein
MAHPLTHLTHGIPTRRPFHPVNMSNISMPNGITEGRAMSCCSLGVQTPAATGMFNAASDWAACCVITIRRQRNGVPENGAQTETKSGKQCG